MLDINEVESKYLSKDDIEFLEYVIYNHGCSESWQRHFKKCSECFICSDPDWCRDHEIYENAVTILKKYNDWSKQNAANK